MAKRSPSTNAIRENAMPLKQDFTKQQGLSKVVLISIIATVLLLAIVGGGLVLMLGGDDIDSFEDTATDSTIEVTEQPQQTKANQSGKAQPAKVANYWALEPPMVANYDRFGKAGFLQVSITLMTYDSDVLLHVNTHSPAIRTQILLIFNGRKYEDLVGADNQVRLQNEVKDEVNRQLRELAGLAKGVDAVYFTTYVLQ